MKNAVKREEVDARPGTVSTMPAMFVLGFGILYVRTLLQATTVVQLPDGIDKVFFVAGITFLFLHVVSAARLYGKGFWPYIAVIAAMLVCYARSGETAPLTVALVLIAGSTAARPRELVRCWFDLTVFSLLTLAALYFAMAIFDPSLVDPIYRVEDGLASRGRYSFFFAHPNMMGAFAMMLSGAYLYLRYDDLKPLNFVAIGSLNVAVFLLTDSRTALVLSLALIVLFWWQKRRGVFDGRRVRVPVAAFFVLCLLTVLAVSGPLYSETLGSLLTGRVSLWHYCYINQGVTVFGQRFEETRYTDSTGWTYYYTTLDSAYASCLFTLGLAFTAFILWCLWTRLGNADDDLAREMPLILVMLVFGITEVHVFNIAMCVSLLCLSGGLAKSASQGRRLWSYPEVRE